MDINEFLDIGIGDLVSVNGEGSNVYIVVGIEDYSDEDEDEVDISYELAKVFPQNFNAILSSEDLGDVKLHTKMGTDNYKLRMKILSEQRESKGWGKADYIELVEESLKHINKKSKVATKHGELIDSDGISDMPFETIDECLDAINGLESLYNLFKDEKYIEKKKLVIEKLTKLSQ